MIKISNVKQPQDAPPVDRMTGGEQSVLENLERVARHGGSWGERLAKIKARELLESGRMEPDARRYSGIS